MKGTRKSSGSDKHVTVRVRRMSEDGRFVEISPTDADRTYTLKVGKSGGWEMRSGRDSESHVVKVVIDQADTKVLQASRAAERSGTSTKKTDQDLVTVGTLTMTPTVALDATAMQRLFLDLISRKVSQQADNPPPTMRRLPGGHMTAAGRASGKRGKPKVRTLAAGE